MIDTSTETLIPIREIPDHVPGSRVHSATVWRWVLTGCRGVILETVFVGGKRYTSKAAIGRFIEETTAARTCRKPSQGQRSKTNQRRIDAAYREFGRASA